MDIHIIITILDRFTDESCIDFGGFSAVNKIVKEKRRRNIIALAIIFFHLTSLKLTNYQNLQGDRSIMCAKCKLVKSVSCFFPIAISVFIASLYGSASAYSAARSFQDLSFFLEGGWFLMFCPLIGFAGAAMASRMFFKQYKLELVKC
jgi:hypothetical protein